MKKYVCTICGYVHEADAPPEFCPICKAPATKFVEQKSDEISWAAEHVVGVAKGVDTQIIEGLRENFTGECSEVGMYLAMARQADREGFPEIAEAYTRIAWEEAGHAALFGEMLGEVLKADTRANLKMRAAAEHGACAGKAALADLAEKQALPAIRDAVREMARDEARHGSVFRGLSRRYFKSS